MNTQLRAMHPSASVYPAENDSLEPWRERMMDRRRATHEDARGTPTLMEAASCCLEAIKITKIIPGRARPLTYQVVAQARGVDIRTPITNGPLTADPGHRALQFFQFLSLFLSCSPSAAPPKTDPRSPAAGCIASGWWTALPFPSLPPPHRASWARPVPRANVAILS